VLSCEASKVQIAMRSARVATGKAGPVYPEQDPQQERKKLLKTPGNIEPYDLDRAGI